MKREILFRGKGVNDGNWLYGYYLKYTDIVGEVTAVCPLPEEGKYYHIEDCYVDPATVGQYTGLCDKDGVTKIFEGDVVFAGYGEYYQGTHEHSTTIIIDMADYEALNALCNANEVVVIGNIHDTPDLGLKEESE